MSVPAPELQVLELTDAYGKFALEPLEQGFGPTLGNPLRRVLLSALPGAAVTWVRIDGVLHEYSSIPHVKEEVLEVLQNVKGVRLRSLSGRPGRMRLEVQGPGEVTAADIVASADFEVVKPEQHIATLESEEAKLVIEFNVEHGKGYQPAQHGDGLPIGTLQVDALFAPVRKVNYRAERTRVGQRTDFERLLLEVWTDGTISPVEALQQAAKILVDQFFLFAAVGKAGVPGVPRSEAALAIPAEVYNMPVERLELSSRTLNCLKRANIHKVGEILEKDREQLLKIRNFGEKSLGELLNRLKEKEIPVPKGLAGEVPLEGEVAPEGPEEDQGEE
ncbi:MAG: DNA-directed RNA polymerase subunit alpha [Chloroflexi bacterium]|nr:DNA-directed RNA polymerase subunit alpha [Chloroflexota bacterium]